MTDNFKITALSFTPTYDEDYGLTICVHSGVIDILLRIPVVLKIVLNFDLFILLLILLTASPPSKCAFFVAPDECRLLET